MRCEVLAFRPIYRRKVSLPSEPDLLEPMGELAEKTIVSSKGGIALEACTISRGEVVVDLVDGDRERLREFFIRWRTTNYRIEVFGGHP